jgi:hypothetical protein
MDKSERIGVAIRDASARVDAPHSLRAEVASERLARPSRRRRASWIPITAGLAAACVAAVLVFTLNPDSGSPSVSTAAGAGLGTATRPAPAVHGRFVDARVGSVRFPDYSYGLPFKAVGARHETIAGRNAVTVFYAGGGRRIGYTVLDGKPLSVPSSAKAVSYADLDAFSFTKDDARVVTWRRNGLTCILVSRSVDEQTMLQMAAWT